MDKIGEAFVPMITLLIAQITAVDLGYLRIRGKKLCLVLVLELLLQVIFNVTILLMFGLQVYVKWYVITMDLPAILLFFFISGYRDQRAWYTILCTIFVSFAISFFAIWVINIFSGSYILYNVTRVLLFIPTFIIIHFKIRRKYQMLQRELSKGWGIYGILPMIHIAAMYYQFNRYGISIKNFGTLLYGSIIILAMLTVFLIFVYIFNQLHDKYLLQEQQRILAIQNKMQKEMFELQYEVAEKTNRRWHDFRFQSNHLIELLEMGGTQAALEYLNEHQKSDEGSKIVTM